MRHSGVVTPCPKHEGRPSAIWWDAFDMKSTLTSTSKLLAVAGCLLTSSAFAYDADYFAYIADSNMHYAMLREMGKRAEISRQLTYGYGRGAPSNLRTAPATTVAVLAASPAFPARMAATFPEKSRPEAERVFRELLVAYGAIEQKFGIQKGDVAGSIAAFVAGNYMAYHNTGFPDKNFKSLVRQMQQVLGSNGDFQKSSVAEKQELYEQMATVGMLMATSQMALAKQPNAQAADNMKRTAKGYLEQFLKMNADKVEITAQGIIVR